MDFCDNSSYFEYFSNQNYEGIDIQKILYTYFCPILIIACVISVVLNAILVIIGNSKTVNKSPILTLSLNLATTDCFASLFVGIGLVVNSYLPIVFHISMESIRCSLLVMEIFRLSALIASAMHLLSLALVHYKGIVKPLHYRAVIFCSHHRTRSIHLMSIMCWIIPMIFLSIYFSSIPCQGFLVERCSILFMYARNYRLAIVIAFFIPLVMMLILYARIFFIIKNHQENRNAPGSVRSFNSIKQHQIIKQSKRESVDSNASHHNNVSRKSPTQSSPQKHKELIANLKLCTNCVRSESPTEVETSINVKEAADDTRKTDSINSHGSGTHSLKGNTKTNKVYRFQPQVQGHTKALTTTLLILGTYILCWMPAVMYYGLTCINGCPFPLTKISIKNRIIIGFITNGLVIVKAIVDPFIYTYRMKEMKLAFNRYCARRTNTKSSTSQRTGTMTTLKSSPASLKHRFLMAETSLK